MQARNTYLPVFVAQGPQSLRGWGRRSGFKVQERLVERELKTTVILEDF